MNPKIAIVPFPGDYSVWPEGVHGFISFNQIDDVNIEVSWSLEGLDNNKTYGFHIHESSFADKRSLGIGCNELGGHFNPTGDEHGKHAGDLCYNIETNNKGISEGSYITNKISLKVDSDKCILGRSVVVHGLQDDEGKQGRFIDGIFIKYTQMTKEQINILGLNKNADELMRESLVTGNAGCRILCGNIIPLFQQ